MHCDDDDPNFSPVADACRRRRGRGGDDGGAYYLIDYHHQLANGGGDRRSANRGRGCHHLCQMREQHVAAHQHRRRPYRRRQIVQ